MALVLRPAGFGSWDASGALVTGFLAKEVVVGTMNQVYIGEGDAAATEPTSFGKQLGASLVGFGKAAALTIQEVLNIIPRTINLLPVVDIGEVRFFGDDGAEENNTRLEQALVDSFTRSAGSAAAGAVAAVAFTVFVLLYVPCMTAVAAMRHEFGGRWLWTQIAYTLGLAWVAAALFFHIGTWLS